MICLNKLGRWISRPLVYRSLMIITKSCVNIEQMVCSLFTCTYSYTVWFLWGMKGDQPIAIFLWALLRLLCLMPLVAVVIYIWRFKTILAVHKPPSKHRMHNMHSVEALLRAPSQIGPLQQWIGHFKVKSTKL